MEQNVNMHKEIEQHLLSQNIKEEVWNDSYREDDPLAVTVQDRTTSLRMHIKEEVDVKEEDLLEEKIITADLKQTTYNNGLNTINNSIFRDSLTDSVLFRLLNDKKRITTNDKQSSFEASVFQNTRNKNIFEETTEITSQDMILDNENEKFGCSSCTKKYSVICDLKKHIELMHLGNSDYKCLECNKLFLHSIQLEKHICYENAEIHKCQVCNKQFSHPRTLKLHIAVHNDRKYVCDYCGEIFLEIFHLMNHTNSKHQKDEIIYACGHCYFIFSQIDLLEQHTRVAHSKIVGNYICVQCHETFIQPYDLKNHFLKIHKILNEKMKEQNKSLLNIKTKDKKLLNIKTKDKKYACTICDEKYFFISDLRSHIGAVHSGFGEFKCVYCSIIFSEPAELVEHICTKIYKCKFCNKEFRHPGYLKRHSAVHFQIDSFEQVQQDETSFHSSELKRSSTTYECKICYKKFSRLSKLTQHSHVHKEKKFACNDCDTRFFEFFKLKNHITTIHCKEGLEMACDKIYACDTCDERYSWLTDLKNHIKVRHLGNGRFRCILCSKTFSCKAYSHFKNHINLKHKIRELNFHGKDKKYFCSDCNKGYNDFRGIKGHIEMAHLKMNDYKCLQCNKMFSRITELKRHYNTNGHKNYKKFDCDICKKKFSHLSLLRIHMSVHCRTQKFVCEICGKGFFIFSYLKNHISLSHLKPKNYQCEECGKTFIQKCGLELHTNAVHKKIRDFKCRLCYKKYKNPSHLRNHIICVHEKVKNFVCEQCGGKFSLAHNLKRHVNEVHKGIKVYRKRI